MSAALALSSLFVTGCLVAEAPEYGAPRRTPPVIDSQDVIPSPLFVQNVGGDFPDTIALKVAVRSEDAGEELVGSLLLDYGSSDPTPWFDRRLPPSSFDDLGRSMDMNFRVDERASVGECHTLTMLIMHSQSYDDIAKVPHDDSRSAGDVASVTWWLRVGPADPDTLVSCPNEGEGGS